MMLKFPLEKQNDGIYIAFYYLNLNEKNSGAEM